MATAFHHVEKIVYLRDDVLKHVSANLTGRWQNVAKNLHLEGKILLELKMKNSDDETAYLMLRKWKKSCKEDSHVRLIQALSISGEASLANEVLTDFLSQIIGQLLSTKLNMNEMTKLANTFQIPLVADSENRYDTGISLMKDLFKGEVITTNEFTKLSLALEMQNKTLLSDTMKTVLAENIRKVQGTPESFNYLDFLYTLAETMKPREVNSLCTHFHFSSTDMQLVQKSHKPGLEFINILRKKKILQKSDISELSDALKEQNYTKLLSVAEDYRTYKSLPQIWVEVTSAYSSNEIPASQSLKTLGVFRIFKRFYRRECRGNILESVAFGSLRFLLRVPSMKALDSLLKSVQSGRTAKAILSILKRELKEDKSRLPNKLLAKLEDGAYETTKEALKSTATFGTENIAEADPGDLATFGTENTAETDLGDLAFGTENTAEADPGDLDFSMDSMGPFDTLPSCFASIYFDDTETIAEADRELEEHHTDPSIQTFKQNMESFLTNVTEFTRHLSSLYGKDQVFTYQDPDNVKRFYRLRDAVKDDAKEYLENLFPTYTGLVKYVQQFCRYYAFLEFNEWSQQFDSITEKVEKHCQRLDDFSHINNECIRKLKEKEKETSDCINNLMEGPKSTNTGVLPIKVTLEEENIGSVVGDSIISACKVLIDGINETSAFFVKVEARLSLLKDESKITSKSTRKFLFDTAKREAERLSEICNIYFNIIPRVNMELSSIPEMSVSNALVPFDDQKAWEEKLRHLLRSNKLTPGARERLLHLLNSL